MDKIIVLINNFTEELRRMGQSNLGKVSRKRLLTNLFHNLNELSNFQDNLDPYNLVGIEQLKNRISDEIIEDANTHFFGNLYQIEYDLNNKRFDKLQNLLSWTINDVSVMHIQVLQGSSLGDSLGSSFIDRLSGLVNVDNKLITTDNQQFKKLAIINLCAINRCLVEIYEKIGGG